MGAKSKNLSGAKNGSKFQEAITQNHLEEFSVSINKTFILEGGLSTTLSFYEV